jgi:hypothetical protein
MEGISSLHVHQDIADTIQPVVYVALFIDMHLVQFLYDTMHLRFNVEIFLEPYMRISRKAINKSSHQPY